MNSKIWCITVLAICLFVCTLEIAAAQVLKRVFVNGKYGYVDDNDSIVIPPIFESTGARGDFKNNNCYAVVRLEGREGLIDCEGRYKAEPQYDRIRSFYDKYASIELDGKEGFIDSNGVEIVAPIYDGVSPFFSEGYAGVVNDGRHGAVDTNGRVVVPLIYESVQGFSDGFSRITVAGKYGYVNTNGKVVVEPIYDDAYPFQDGLAIVCYRDSTGRLGNTSDAVQKRCGFIDEEGRIVIPIIYQTVFPFSEGLAAVCLDGRCGFIDKEGDIVIDLKYYAITNGFYEGLAPVALDSSKLYKYGYINKAEEFVIEPKYVFANPFINGEAEVLHDGHYYYIDRKGNILELIE